MIVPFDWHKSTSLKRVCAFVLLDVVLPVGGAGAAIYNLSLNQSGNQVARVCIAGILIASTLMTSMFVTLTMHSAAMQADLENLRRDVARGVVQSGDEQGALRICRLLAGLDNEENHSAEACRQAAEARVER